ncbi:Pro-Pol polyprotein [Smittium culicis]|uniref:Pro-Pol polyprotein n=1 Tax=Smittium culicis TaxID=133412 RepID=A0A1R1XK70_9FUNG|nr:Pro-Pol polyprotein [Smittium culicis]
MVGVESLTGYPGAEATEATESTTAKEAISALKRIFSLFGYPLSFCVDRNPFGSDLFKNYCRINKIKLQILPPYQPEWNGQVERINSPIRQSLNKMSDESPKEWYRHIESVLQVIRGIPSKSTGCSPYYNIFGVHPKLLLETDELSPLSKPARKISLSMLAIKRRTYWRTRKIEIGKPMFEVGYLV